MPASSSRTGIAGITAALFAGLCATYVLILAPSVGWRDSGEITAASFHLGIAHPTGFPLVLLIAKAFEILVPLGNVAMRTNMACAVLMAAAVTFLARLAHDVVSAATGEAGRLAPMAAGFLVAAGGLLAPAVTAFAANAEVYACSAACAAGSAYLAHESIRTGDPRPGVLSALVAGLALGCHVAAVLASAIPVGMILLRSRSRGPRLLAWTSAAAIAGGIVILYLPFRSIAAPHVMWDDLSTIEALWRHISAGRIREAFAGRMGGVTALDDSMALIRFLAAHAGPLPFVLAPAGAILAWRASRPASVVLCLVLLSDFLYSVLLNPMAIGEGQDGTIAILAIVALAGIALGETVRLGSRISAWAGPAVSVVALATLVAASPRAESPTGRDDLPSAWAGAVLSSLPARPVLLCQSDDLCGIGLYLQRVEGERPDAGVLPRQHLWHEMTIRRSLGRSHPAIARDLLDAPRSVEGRLRWLAGEARENGIFWELGDTSDIEPAFGRGMPPLDLGPGSSPPVARVGTDPVGVADVLACVDRLERWLALTGHDPATTACSDLGTPGCRALARDFLGLGLLLSMRGDPDSAREAFHVATAIKPDYAPALANLSRLDALR